MMVNVVGSKDNYQRWKPDKYKDYLTMAELCAIVRRDRRRIVQLEKTNVLPAPIRVKVGKLSVRLYSLEQARQIEEHFRTARPGNPNLRREK